MGLFWFDIEGGIYMKKIAEALMPAFLICATITLSGALFTMNNAYASSVSQGFNMLTILFLVLFAWSVYQNLKR